ncbi:MAG: acyl-ACP desaturase [Planctomycetales bacterium]|nr:acyl-ACP desaturase [Planctomycetales bacterium]
MTTRIEEKLYRIYWEFFEKAERERRWSVFDDIPWDKVNQEASEDLALCAETFCCVELYLPDYITYALGVVRNSFGQSWFQANWGYEESKHALSLGEYLVRSGKRTKDQLHDLHNRIFSKQFVGKYPTAIGGTCYGIVQEMATFLIYCKHRARAAAEGDECLRTIYNLIARDEIAHAHFYGDAIKVFLESDREGTLEHLVHVMQTFEMPGVDIVPDYDSRILKMREAGIDSTVFNRKVFQPILSYLSVTRDEMRKARLSLKAKDDKRRPKEGVSAPASARAM